MIGIKERLKSTELLVNIQIEHQYGDRNAPK